MRKITRIKDLGKPTMIVELGTTEDKYSKPMRYLKLYGSLGVLLSLLFLVACGVLLLVAIIWAIKYIAGVF